MTRALALVCVAWLGCACDPIPRGNVDAGSAPEDAGTAASNAWLIALPDLPLALVHTHDDATIVFSAPGADDNLPHALAVTKLASDGSVVYSHALDVSGRFASFVACATAADELAWLGVSSKDTVTPITIGSGITGVQPPLDVQDVLFLAIDDTTGVIARGTVVPRGVRCNIAGFADGTFATLTQASFALTTLARHNRDGDVVSSVSLTTGVAVLAALPSGDAAVASNFTQDFDLAVADFQTTVTVPPTELVGVLLAISPAGILHFGALLRERRPSNPTPFFFPLALVAANGTVVAAAGESFNASIEDIITGAQIATISGGSHLAPFALTFNTDGSFIGATRFNAPPAFDTAMRGFFIDDASDEWAVLTPLLPTRPSLIGRFGAVARTSAPIFVDTFDALGNLHVTANAVYVDGLVPALATTAFVDGGSTVPGLPGALVDVVMRVDRSALGLDP